MAADDLPDLIVGDVHGDIERLAAALQPYPASEWRTIFLGDLVDFGLVGGRCLRYARDRQNTDVILGNHEVAMLWALQDPTRIGFFISIGGHQHDLDELRADEPLQEWLKTRPLMIKLRDGTLVQHCSNDDYRMLLGNDESGAVNAINSKASLVLEAGDAHLLWEVMSGKGVFATQPERLERWLQLTGCRRVVFGHTPHRNATPARYHGGKAINFDRGPTRWHGMKYGMGLLASAVPTARTAAGWPISRAIHPYGRTSPRRISCVFIKTACVNGVRPRRSNLRRRLPSSCSSIFAARSSGGSTRTSWRPTSLRNHSSNSPADLLRIAAETPNRLQAT